MEPIAINRQDVTLFCIVCNIKNKNYKLVVFTIFVII